MITMKIGDKLLCKRTIPYYLEIGKYYSIDDIFSDIITINNLWFDEKEIYLYFRTPQEERKIKLQILKLKSLINKNE